MPSTKNPNHLKLTRFLAWSFFGLAIVCLVIGLCIGWRQHKQNVQSVKWATAHSAGAPSTAKPSKSAFDSYTVAADLARYILIPKLKVAAIVRPLGVTKTGQIDAPSNVFDAGWYNQSSKPGQPGAMVVDGHISSWTTRGIFYGLSSLKPGDTVQIQKGDNTKLTYTVVSTKTYDTEHVDMNAVLNPVSPSRPGLNLITCAGSVIKGTNEFDERIVVFAKLN